MEKVNKPRLNVMFDIETLSTQKDAVILSIAFKTFSFDGNDPVDLEENIAIDVFSSLLNGRTIDTGTCEWWSKQTPEAINSMNEMMKTNATDFCRAIKEVFAKLKELSKSYNLYVWSKGIDFDFPILESALEAVSKKDKEVENKTPWFYSHKRDVRTWKDFAMSLGWNPSEATISHDALADCKLQIEDVVSAYAFMVRGA